VGGVKMHIDHRLVAGLRKGRAVHERDGWYNTGCEERGQERSDPFHRCLRVVIAIYFGGQFRRNTNRTSGNPLSRFSVVV
jgi:hypothetical protein